MKKVVVCCVLAFLAIPLVLLTATILAFRLSFFLAEEFLGWLEEK